MLVAKALAVLDPSISTDRSDTYHSHRFVCRACKINIFPRPNHTFPLFFLHFLTIFLPMRKGHGGNGDGRRALDAQSPVFYQYPEIGTFAVNAQVFTVIAFSKAYYFKLLRIVFM